MKHLLLFSLEERRLLGEFLAVFQYLKRTHRTAGEGKGLLFRRACSDRVRGNGF